MKHWNMLGLFLPITLLISISALAGGYSLSEPQRFQQRKDWDGYLRYGKAWTQAEPNNSTAWGVVSAAYFFGLNRPDLALEPTKRAVTLSPQDAGAWTGLGHVYMKLKRYYEAVDAFNHSAQLAPYDGNHWNNLATAYSYDGDYRMAFQTMEKQEQVAGAAMNNVHWYNLGNGYLNAYYSGQNGTPVGSGGTEILRRAEHAYQKSLRMNSRFADAWNNLGTTEQALGAAQNALNDYKQAAALGDPLAQGNYNNLQNAIAAARAQAAQAGRCGPITEYRQGCPFVPGWVVAHETAVFNWNHSYHEPGDIRGRPY